MPDMAERIRTKLTEALDPQAMEIIDESHLHAGHSGSREGGETHFRVKIVSPAFSGMSRIDRHRLVNKLLQAELEERVHALALKTTAPEEAQ
ncbi:BolA family protein [Amorphus orientalis]|uniref:BolA protein n=1 Tax=Amorphus orientalis TaxID=649198 RepID=A0AAE4ATS6_9HYPH|nr:BolA protein [Amorphus orientalis]